MNRVFTRSKRVQGWRWVCSYEWEPAALAYPEKTAAELEDMPEEHRPPTDHGLESLLIIFRGGPRMAEITEALSALLRDLDHSAATAHAFDESIRQRFLDYYEENPTWGSLHIVLDDGNTEEDSVRFCVRAAEKSGDTEGAFLARLLLPLTDEQREWIYEHQTETIFPQDPPR